MQLRSQADSTQAFLNHRKSEQAKRNARIPDQANLRELNGIVRAAALALPSPSFVRDQGQLSAIRDAYLVDVAQLLGLLGFKAGDLRRNEATGSRLVRAAAAKIRGNASVEDEVVLADTVIIGTVQTNQQDSRGDGFHSTIHVLAEEVFKGASRVGGTVQVRRISGPTAGGVSLRATTEDPMPAGAKVALIGSNARYLNEHATGARCSSCVVEQVPLFLITGTALVPTGGYSKSATKSTLTLAAD